MGKSLRAPGELRAAYPAGATGEGLGHRSIPTLDYVSKGLVCFFNDFVVITVSRALSASLLVQGGTNRDLWHGAEPAELFLAQLDPLTFTFL